MSQKSRLSKLNLQNSNFRDNFFLIVLIFNKDQGINSHLIIQLIIQRFYSLYFIVLTLFFADYDLIILHIN